MTVVVIIQLWSVDPKQMARVGNSLSRSFSFLLKIAHFKEQTWAIRTLKKSYVSDLLAIRADFSQKRAISSKNCIFRKFLTVFPLFMPERESLLSHFAHLFFFKERFTLFREQTTLSLTKNKWIARKTDERIPNPAKWPRTGLTLCKIQYSVKRQRF